MQIDGHKDVGIGLFNTLKRNTETRVLYFVWMSLSRLNTNKVSLNEQLKYLRYFSRNLLRFASHEPLEKTLADVLKD